MSALDDVRARLAGAMAMLTQKQMQEFDARRAAEADPVINDGSQDRAVDFAVLQRQQAAQEVTDLVADALAEFGNAIDALRADMATERAKEAARRAEAAKWRGAMDRKLEQVGGRTIHAAGLATAAGDD